MAPLRLPIGAEAAQGQAEHARGQVGITGAFGQDEEAAVVDDKEPAAGVLARRPPQPALAALEMEGGGAEGEQGDPLAVEFGDVAQRLAGEAGIGQVMLVCERLVKHGALVGAEQAEGDARQNISFVGCG